MLCIVGRSLACRPGYGLLPDWALAKDAGAAVRSSCLLLSSCGLESIRVVLAAFAAALDGGERDVSSDPCECRMHRQD